MIPGPESNSPERRCPNCHNLIPSNLPYCSVCGWGTAIAKRITSNVWALVGFIAIGIPAALCGGCAMLLGGGMNTPMGLAGIAGFAVFAGMLWLLVKSSAKPRM